MTDLDDPVLGRLTDDRLTRDYRVFQRAKGHRFSSDDMVTAFVAMQAAPQASHVLDLGCGLGSVLLHLAWSLPNAWLVGIEAQDASFELLRRNVERNPLSGRVTTILGDLRDEDTLARVPKPGPGFDLITGTPPYFPPCSAVDAIDDQRAYARLEYRGGVEAYVTTAARLLSEDGALVLCGDSRAEARVAAPGAAVGLHLTARCAVLAQAGRPPLFSVWTLRRVARALAPSTLTLRDASGARTPDAERLRQFSGFGPGAS